MERVEEKKSRVLIIGATGNLGFELAKASLQSSHPTFALVRNFDSDSLKSQKLQFLSNAGTTLLKGSLQDEESLVEAVKLVDVVICAVSSKQALDQKLLVQVIKNLGSVKRFIPAEFGLDPYKTQVSDLDHHFFSNFVGRYLAIQNAFEGSGKAVALRVSGDKAEIYSCRILSHQDTLLDDAGRHYYKNCYIEGSVDFICGNAASLFEKCHLHSVAEQTGWVTAQHRASSVENTGYTFLGCKITGIGETLLGRPWGAYSRVVFALTYMSGVIQPEGWNDWGDPSNQRTAFYGEYKCYGPGADRSKRVAWSRSLSKEEAKPFVSKGMIGGGSWLRISPVHFKKRPATTTLDAKM